MSSKTLIYICLTIGGLIGGYLGSLMDHGNILGLWGLLFTTIGGFLGIWAGFKLGQNL